MMAEAPRNYDVSERMVTAMQDLTDRLDRLGRYYDKIEERAQQNQAPRILRAEQNDALRRMGLPVTGDDRASTAARLAGYGRTPLYGDDVEWGNEPDQPSTQQPSSISAKFRQARQTAQNQGWRKALGQMANRPGWEQDTASYPPGAGPSQDPQSLSESDALTMAVLGEHGGPRVLRNLMLEQYGLQRSLNWAQNVTNRLSNEQGTGYLQQEGNVPDWVGRLGVTADHMQPIQDILRVAADHPLATYAGLKTLGTITNAIGGAYSNIQSAQAMGQQFGYGPPPGGQNVFGFWNPLGGFGSAAQVGTAFNIEQSQLMGRVPGGFFGSGLSGAQAQETLSNLAGQGFAMNPIDTGVGGDVLSGISSIPGIGGPLAGLIGGIFGDHPSGDAATIAQNLNLPLMQRFPGLQAQDIGQFDPLLRNSGASIEDLTQGLSDLGSAARATKETVGQAADALATYQQQTASMGGDTVAGLQTAQTFRMNTGLDPQILAQMLQNPMTQGVALSQYGILPSALGGAGGLATSASMQTLNMLMHATAGLDHNRRVYDPETKRWVTVSGRQQQIDQVAQMMGISPNVARRMVGDQRGIVARSRLTETLQGPGDTFQNRVEGAMAHHHNLTDAQRAHLQQYWMHNIAPDWQHTGVSHGQMERLSREGFSQRIKDLRADINNANANDSWNRITQGPNAQTVQVQFTGLAAKFFQQSNLTPAKLAANAGGQGYNSTVNSVTGDPNVTRAGRWL